MDQYSPWLSGLLCAIFLLCAILCFFLCKAIQTFFPMFRSGEHKPGIHTPDQSRNKRESKATELPLVGGPALILTLLCVGIGSAWALHFRSEQWTLLLLALGATLGYGLIGFIDDWHKVYRKEGISEYTKFGSVFITGASVAIFYFFLLPQNSQESYSFWKDLPFLNAFLCPTPLAGTRDICSVTGNPLSYYGWLIFLVLMTGFIGSLTSISVDFSDGLDGLAGGLVFSTSLALGIIVSGLVGTQPSGVVLELLALLSAGAVLGYLPWNWPSAWAPRRNNAPRRAKIIMGDCGALSMGGILAMTAIFSRNETLLLMIGGAFVLEGLSALISARLLTRFFRRHLSMLRFVGNNTFVPHTEFPLPFLATPLHYHFDLLGWDRRRLVYGAWALGASFAALGVAVGLAPLPWERYAGRFIAILLATVIWSSGSWSKLYFVGKYHPHQIQHHRLALYYGFPLRIWGMSLYHLVEVVEASTDVVETPAEELTLWQRMTIFDARSLLGLYCYRAGYYSAALAQWTCIPEYNRRLRPEITHLLREVERHLSVETYVTQPMKRADIQPQETEAAWNHALGDHPNPYQSLNDEKKQMTQSVSSVSSGINGQTNAYKIEKGLE